MYNTRLASLSSSLSPLRSERRMQKTTEKFKFKTNYFLRFNSWSLFFINELSKLIMVFMHYCLWQLIICSKTHLTLLASSHRLRLLLRKDCKNNKKVFFKKLKSPENPVTILWFKKKYYEVLFKYIIK